MFPFDDVIMNSVTEGVVVPLSIDVKKDMKGDGVSLQIRKGFTFILRNDLDYFDSETEPVFIDIDNAFLT